MVRASSRYFFSFVRGKLSTKTSRKINWTFWPFRRQKTFSFVDFRVNKSYSLLNSINRSIPFFILTAILCGCNQKQTQKVCSYYLIKSQFAHDLHVSGRGRILKNSKFRSHISLSQFRMTVWRVCAMLHAYDIRINHLCVRGVNESRSFNLDKWKCRKRS